ncbi:hypothetical protein [Trichloromonas sp.]|uniref:hypothetical protein n=1 Tax=Trichloromonas sp. TaxID=3069249 RepID=UPI002A3FC6AD|nr:hypothetical protein [Trichloromonas sp.]
MMRLVFLLWLVSAGPLWASGFTFSGYEQQQAQEEAAQVAEERRAVGELLSVDCSSKLKGQRIAVLIGEERSGQGRARRTNDGPLFDEINSRLRGLGLKTCTQKEIDAQVADAERTAFLNNDMDAAISAAGRLQARFLLRGLIAVSDRRNPILDIDEVFLTLTLTLLDRKGRVISSVLATADSYVANDTLQTALQLTREKADRMLAQLYNDYCRQGR